ncbi:MAG: hypothetical protein AB1465_04120 [Patescibacteria group bacterium]
MILTKVLSRPANIATVMDHGIGQADIMQKILGLGFKKTTFII